MQARLGADDEEEDNGPPLVGPKTVLVDFTADWCLTCKQNEARVMRKAAVVDDDSAVGRCDAQGRLDAPRKSTEVTRMLDVLGSRQVPVIAVFSANDPKNLDGLPRQLYAGGDS